MTNLDRARWLHKIPMFQGMPFEKVTEAAENNASQEQTHA